MKRVKRILFYFLFFLILIGLAYKLLIIEKSYPTISCNTDSSIDIVDENIIVDKLHSTKKLISLESDLKQSIILDQSFGNISPLKKIQKIDFYGQGNYVINLESLKKSDVVLNNKENQLIVTIPKPTINDVFINKEKTIYYTTDNGLLRFGDITLSASDYSYIEKQVEKKMREELSSTKLYEKAEFSSKQQIRGLIETLYKDQNIDIKIELK